MVLRRLCELVLIRSSSTSPNCPFEQNIAETRQAVEVLKSINPDLVVGGEIGYIGSRSEIRNQPPPDLALTKPEEARQFVRETRVDVLSPPVGNMHGLLKSLLAGTAEKRLRIDLSPGHQSELPEHS